MSTPKLPPFEESVDGNCVTRLHGLLTLRGFITLRLLILSGGVLVLGAVNVMFAYAIFAGDLDGQWYDVRDLGFAVARFSMELDARFDPAVSYWTTAVVGAVGILSFLGAVLIFGSWVER